MEKKKNAGMIVESFAGPIVNAFIRDGKCDFGVVYRNQRSSQASGFIVQAYGDKQLCIYNDSKKNIESVHPADMGKSDDPDDLDLVEAVIGSDGAIISRKKIGDRPSRLNYFTGYEQRLSVHSYLFPLGRNRVNMVRYFTEIGQWGTIGIN